MAESFTRKLVAWSALLFFAALGPAGCAHPKAAAAPQEADYNWGDYKGGSGSDSSAAAPKSDAPKPATTASAEAPKGDVDATKQASSDASALPHKPSKAKIRGESVSSVGVDALAGASKSALKSKVVSSNVVVGSDYEMVQVVLKGASVQIVRPASAPDQAGPKVRSPKARNDSLAATESGWYDADADVLVLVRASKAVKSKKALSSLLQR